MSELDEHPNLSTLSLFLDGEGPFAVDRFESAELRADVEAHAKSCESCRSMIERLLTISVAMKDLPDLPAPTSLLAGVRERIVAESLAETKDLEPIPEHSSHAAVSVPRAQKSGRARSRLSTRRWSGLVAASVVIGVMVGFWFCGDAWRGTAPAEREVASAPKSEQPASAPMRDAERDLAAGRAASFHAGEPRGELGVEPISPEVQGISSVPLADLSGHGMAADEWRPLAFGRPDLGAARESIVDDTDDESTSGDHPAGVTFRYLHDSARVEAAPGTALYFLQSVDAFEQDAGANLLVDRRPGGDAFASQVCESLFRNGERPDSFIIRPWEEMQAKFGAAGFTARAGVEERSPGLSAIDLELEESDYLVLVARLSAREKKLSESPRPPQVDAAKADAVTSDAVQPDGGPGKEESSAADGRIGANPKSRGAPGGSAANSEALKLGKPAAEATKRVNGGIPTDRRDNEKSADIDTRDQPAPGRRRIRIFLSHSP